jgi:hypothetical protein
VTDPVIIDALIRAGPVALILVALATGFLYTKQHVADLRAALVECRTELRESRLELKQMNEIMRDVMVPAVTQSTTLIQRVSEELLWKGRAA